MDKQRRLTLKERMVTMVKTKKMTANTEPLIYMASLYNEYLYLDTVFVQRHQCLFGVKAELYNMVKANIDVYEGAYLLYKAAYKKYYTQFDYRTRHQIELLDWGVLLYGEERYSSEKERSQYGIKMYKPKFR